MRTLLLLLAGCGRLGFGERTTGDGAPPGESIASPDAATIPPGPLVWLRMETNPTQSIIDSANGHATACVGACPTSAPGIHGNGFRFAGTEIDVTAAADIGPLSAFTGAIWINLTALPTSQNACFFTKAFNNANGEDTIVLCITPSGEALFDCETPTGTAVGDMVAVGITPGAWHHLAFSWDGTTKRGYVDGVKMVSTSVSIGQGSQGLALGGARGMYFVQGTLDDALLYGRALSDQEILQLATP